MSVRIWLHASDEERLRRYSEANLESYAGEGEETLVTGEIKSGLLSHLGREFVLGKVRFFEKKGSEHRTPWIRVDNHPCFPNGLYFTPNSWINTRYHGKSKTMDQRTKLKRIELLNAPNNNFIRRVFVTYAFDGKVPKPHEREKHFLVYCDAQHLYHGRITDAF